MQSANRNNVDSFPTYIPSSRLTALAKTLDTILNKSGETEVTITLLLILEEMPIFCITIMFAIGLSYIVFNYAEACFFQF